MVQTKAKSLSKLVALQKLAANRLEASLGATDARRVKLIEERDALIAMQERRYESDVFAVDPALLIKRMGINALAQDRIEQELETQRSALLKQQRRVEHLTSRLEAVRTENERKDFAVLLDEFLSRKTAAKTE
ncbi:hypothetical protein [Ochrobactrum chromiisoli]|uniref:Flagellar FliJ protein n=1 Tax=Ochrobactrum chromiisoli TaxID=2993941 RepID=A0ABT3QPI7_9HYPH|nr:hypothetical protein [Ochrobactrum chromiisoli]MCX2697515.1 hypothetical protein [Ochrobactrum chromiisoli]